MFILVLWTTTCYFLPFPFGLKCTHSLWSAMLHGWNRAQLVMRDEVCQIFNLVMLGPGLHTLFGGPESHWCQASYPSKGQDQLGVGSHHPWTTDVYFLGGKTKLHPIKGTKIKYNFPWCFHKNWIPWNAENLDWMKRKTLGHHTDSKLAMSTHSVANRERYSPSSENRLYWRPSYPIQGQHLWGLSLTPPGPQYNASRSTLSYSSKLHTIFFHCLIGFEDFGTFQWVLQNIGCLAVFSL